MSNLGNNNLFITKHFNIHSLEFVTLRSNNAVLFLLNNLTCGEANGDIEADKQVYEVTYITKYPLMLD